MILYGASLSPFHERCVMVSRLKGAKDAVEFGRIPGGKLHSPEHMARNPFGKIPWLEKPDGSVLPEGQIIAEYLDSVLPGPRLVSENPDVAAEQRLICRLVDLYVIEPALAINRGAKGEDREKSLAALNKGLDCLEHFLNPGSKAVGDSWSIADCVLVPFVFHYKMATRDAGFERWPRLAAWWASAGSEEETLASHDRSRKSLEVLMAMRKAESQSSQ